MTLFGWQRSHFLFVSFSQACSGTRLCFLTVLFIRLIPWVRSFSVVAQVLFFVLCHTFSVVVQVHFLSWVLSFLLSHRHCVCPVSCLFCCYTGTVLVLYHSFSVVHRYCFCPVSYLFCCHTGTVLVLYHSFPVVTQVLFLSCIIPFLLSHRYCACPVSFLFCCCTGTVFVLHYNFCCFPGTVFVLYHTFSVIAQVLFLSFIIPFVIAQVLFLPCTLVLLFTPFLLLHRHRSLPVFIPFPAFPVFVLARCAACDARWRRFAERSRLPALRAEFWTFCWTRKRLARFLAFMDAWWVKLAGFLILADVWYGGSYYYWSLLCSAILCSWADSLRSCRMWFSMSDRILL